jgi:Major Facilitator Superfamily.
MNTHAFSRKTWLAVILFGLFGQLAWTVENMYFNVFVYNTITDDPSVIAHMVFFSALTATLTTLLMGGLSDKLGKRKGLMVGGYILWGLSTLAFALVSVENTSKLIGTAGAVHTTIILVIAMDCLMTFFGSTANDAAFNAWINDITVPSVRGRVESVLAVLPLVATLIIFGGFDGLTQQGNWQLFFIIIGSLVTLGGIIGLFAIKESPNLAKSEGRFFADVLYGFKASTVKAHRRLYLSLLLLGILGISTQVFMPYLIIYIQRYLNIDMYAVVLAAVLIVSSVISVFLGKRIDAVGKMRFFFPAAILFFLGLVLMFFARSFAFVILAGIVLMSGNMLCTACASGLIRDYTPKAKAGHFQGIRIVFQVLIPMAIGPYIGSAIIKDSAATYTDLGVVKSVPTPNIFIGAAIAIVFISIPLFILKRKGMEKGNDENTLER